MEERGEGKGGTWEKPTNPGEKFLNQERIPSRPRTHGSKNNKFKYKETENTQGCCPVIERSKDFRQLLRDKLTQSQEINKMPRKS